MLLLTRSSWSAPVTNSSYTAVSSTSLTLAWDNIAFSSYTLVLSNTSGLGVSIASGTSGVNQNTTSFLNLSPNTSYTILLKPAFEGDTNYIPVSTFTWAFSPGAAGFSVFTTSLVFQMDAAGNNAAAALSLQLSTGSAGDFNVTLSSTGRAESSGLTTLALTGLTPNTSYFIQARSLNFNNMPSSATTVHAASSHTVANPPGTPSVLSVGPSDVTISWSTNSNPATVIYEVVQASDTTFGGTVSSPVAFAASYTGSSATIDGLSTGVTYSFKVRARNSDGVSTAFSAAVSTTPQPLTVVSSGTAVNVGGTSVTTDPGVTIVIVALTDGTTEQTITSTQAATLTYASGIALSLPGGVQVKVIADAQNLLLMSTQTIPVKNGGLTVEAASGTARFNTQTEIFSVSAATDAPQNVLTTIPTNALKTLAVSLNPPSGELKILIPPGALSAAASLRVRLPDSLPSAAALRAAPAPENIAPFAANSLLSGIGIGLEIVLDTPQQPKLDIPISMLFRDSDIGTNDAKQLTLARYDDAAAKWLTLGTSLDAPRRKLTANTRHFSKFQILAMTPASDVEGVRVYPNPLRLHEGRATEMTFTNMNANASIKIFTYSGELVASLISDFRGEARWDARNGYGERVASGVYIAAIEGAGGTKKLLKVAVEK